MDDVHFEHHVFVHEVCQCTFVCHDATYFGRSKKHVFWTLCLKEGIDRLLVAEIELGMRTSHQVRIALTM